jgi:hypothetical protein
MIFEGLAARMRHRAQARAAARRAALAAELAALPGVRAEAIEDGVRLTGRGLRRRFALDAALRWLIAEKTR